MSADVAKPLLKVSRVTGHIEQCPGSLVARCSFCKHEVWVSKAAADLLGNYVFGCEQCFPAKVVKGPATP